MRYVYNHSIPTGLIRASAAVQVFSCVQKKTETLQEQQHLQERVKPFK